MEEVRGSSGADSSDTKYQTRTHGPMRKSFHSKVHKGCTACLQPKPTKRSRATPCLLSAQLWLLGKGINLTPHARYPKREASYLITTLNIPSIVSGVAGIMFNELDRFAPGPNRCVTALTARTKTSWYQMPLTSRPPPPPTPPYQNVAVRRTNMETPMLQSLF